MTKKVAAPQKLKLKNTQDSLIESNQGLEKIRQVEPVIVEIDLSKVIVDGGTQVRAKLDQETIENYRAILTENEQCVFPPIIVYQLEGKDTLLLAAGFHRVAAAKSEGWKTFPGIIRVGTYREALLEAIESNARHGLPYSNQDKRRAVVTLLGDEEWVKFSDGEIARRVAVSQPFVSKLRAELSHNGYEMPSERIVERGGKKYVQDTSKIGKALEKPETGEEAEAPVLDQSQVEETVPLNRVLDSMAKFSTDQLREFVVQLQRLFPELFPKPPKLAKPVQAPLVKDLPSWLKKNYSPEELKTALKEFETQQPEVPSFADLALSKVKHRRKQ